MELLEKIRNTSIVYNLSKYLRLRKNNDFKASNPWIDDADASKRLEASIIENKPFLLSRFGSIEIETALIYLTRNKKNSLLKSIRNGVPLSYHCVSSRIKKNAGVYPRSSSSFDTFSETYISAANDIDLLVKWHHIEYEDFFINEINYSGPFIENSVLEPWFSEDPWTKALRHKKVLVIHPFTQSILQQYAKRKELFKDSDVLPEFDLQLYKAVQSSGLESGPHESWLASLTIMQNEISKLDFDVAIIGAGAYGLPLGSFIKSLMGKCAIHMGGISQILFGIKGKRWESVERYQDLFNRHWTYPNEYEIPEGAKLIENGCYW